MVRLKQHQPSASQTQKAKAPQGNTDQHNASYIIAPVSHWHRTIPALHASKESRYSATGAQLVSITNRASTLFRNDNDTYQSSSSSSSEASFLARMTSSGTLSDRLSALTLLIQSSPLHNTKALEALKSMAERGKGKGGRDECLKALRCIVDWWIGGGGPDRKLKYFCDQPLLHPAVTDQHLLVWYFEDWLKKYFFSVLEIAEALSLDALPYVRTQSLAQIYNLLREKPEQEQNLLRLLVNKLGDTEKSLLQAHPSMKAVVIREVIALVMRPQGGSSFKLKESPSKHIRFSDHDGEPKPKKTVNANLHAKYYSIITLNQIVLSQADREAALQLIDVYFEIFQDIIGEGGQTDSLDEDGGSVRELTKDKRGRVRDHKRGPKEQKPRGTGSSLFTEVEDTHSKLVSAILTGVNRALPFAKIDAATTKLNKHVDTLFFITHTSTFNISLQALVLIQQITSSLSSADSPSTPKNIADRYYRTLYESLFDTRLASSSKQAMYLNLLFKSIKADFGNAGNERIRALVRRFVQVLVSGGGGATEFITGGLFLLGELFSAIPGLREMLNDGLSKGTGDGYDARKRDPQFAHASGSPLWELMPLLHHYHPAVSLHARQLLLSQPITAQADLSLNTFSHFLDRFVYKNPKKVKGSTEGGFKAKGGSAMQPAASALEGIKLVKGEATELSVNDPNFLKKKEHDVPVDQLFFHKFFTRKQEKERSKPHKTEEQSDDQNDDQSDHGSGSSDEEEAEIWKAMKATMPKATGDDIPFDEDSDDIPEDLEDDIEEGLDEDAENTDELAEGGASLAEGSDDEDLLPFEGLIEYDGSDTGGSDTEEAEWGGVAAEEAPQKRKRKEDEGGQRKKRKALPTFASYEDYAKLIDESPEDNI
ncbi:hypothetical protein AX16_007434 [Volvariella volvacea WC 439]|nr:hypothetical protein AX16_007434 [Volvariella volvacea WC 439]